MSWPLALAGVSYSQLLLGRVAIRRQLLVATSLWASFIRFHLAVEQMPYYLEKNHVRHFDG